MSHPTPESHGDGRLPGERPDAAAGPGAAELDPAPLVPMDDRRPGFDIVLRGYDREQVDRHVEWLEGLLGEAEQASSRAEQAADQARADAMLSHQEAVKARTELERGRPTFDALGERITRMLTLAEEEAEAMRAQAHRDVESITTEAHQARQRLASERDAIVGKAERQAYDVVAAARQQAEQIVAEATARAQAIDADARRRLEELTARRDEIRAELARLHEHLASLTQPKR